MSLDTVLQIGKALRKSDKGLKYFNYIEPCPKDKMGNYPLCISIPINDDFSMDFKRVSKVHENEINKLHYLKYKTSDKDSSVKYVYGDIYFGHTFSIKKDGSIDASENGSYRLENMNHSQAAYRQSSFIRGKQDFNSILLNNDKIGVLNKIRINVEMNIELIERIMKYSSAIEYYFDNKHEIDFIDFINNEEELFNIAVIQNYKNISKQNLKFLKIEKFPVNDIIKRKKLFDCSNNQLFIHFSYEGGKHWYNFQDELSAVILKMLEEFVEPYSDGYVLKKTIYKTLCSGDKKSDIQFPNFTTANKHKTKLFSVEEINNLFYAIDYTNRGKIITGTEIKKIVLPRGKNLTQEDYLLFAEKTNEDSIIVNNRFEGSLFDFLTNDIPQITMFDLILCKKGSFPSPDADLIEISNIEKSKLKATKERISNIANQIYKERSEYINAKNELNPLSIEYSFSNILGKPQFDEKTKKTKFMVNPKYQSHLLKILPQIYTDNYFNDDMLLPSLVRNVESSIRNGDSKYIILKYDLKFLLSIQNNSNNKYMEITDSKSYQFGVKLGKLSKPLKKKINSFEKTYVGLLTRRVTTKDDCVRFVNDICEKLTMHEKVWSTMCAEVCKDLTGISSADYDKEKVAFGFFEGYFKYEPIDKKKNFQSRLEKLLSEYEGNEELKDETEKLSELVEYINK